MPERITNKINVEGSDFPVCRPSVINMYNGDLSTLSLRWSAWEKFMFNTPLAIQSKDGTFGSLIEQSKNCPLGQKFWAIAPGSMDARDENSVILLAKKTCLVKLV